MSRTQTQDPDKALLATETAFIADPDRRSVEYWYQGISGVVSLDRVRDYAREQRWVERRQAFWRGVQAAWLKQRHLELIRQRVSELKDATEIRDVLVRQLRPRMGRDGIEYLPVKINSYEAGVRAFVAVDGMIEGKRGTILEDLDPLLAQAEQSDDGVKRDLPFSRTEMRGIAHGLLKARRTARRKELSMEDDDDSDSDDQQETSEDSAVARPEAG